MKILLDTNFLLIPAKNKVDIFKELSDFGIPELFTLDLVLKELDKLIRTRGRDSGSSKIALELLKQHEVTILETSKTNTDDEIVRISLEREMTVCTQDRELKKRLKDKKIPVISLRQGRYLTRI